MGCEILSVINFSSSSREVGLFYHFIMPIFYFSIRNTLVKKYFSIAMSRTKVILFAGYNHLFSTPGGNNAHNVLLTAIDAVPGNKSG